MSHKYFRSKKILADLNNYWLEAELQTTKEELDSLYYSVLHSKTPAVNLEKIQQYARLRFAPQILANQKPNKKNLDEELNAQIETIENELRFFYTSEKMLDDAGVVDLTTYSISPRLKFLIKKYFYLKTRKNFFHQFIEPNHLKHTKTKTNNLIKTLFNVGKKLFDSVDDIWNAMKGILPINLIQLVSPILIGSIGFLIHIGEGIEGLEQAYHAYKNTKMRQRKTRLASGIITAVFAGVGIGLAIALLASAGGAAVSGATLLPVLIPAFLTGIYSISLWKTIYIYTQVRKQAALAKNAYHACLTENSTTIKTLQAQLQQVDKKIYHLNLITRPILNKIQHQQDLTANEHKVYDNYLTLMTELTAIQTNHQKKCAELYGKIDALREEYHYFKKKSFKAGRDTVFTSLEVAASVVVLVFGILSMGVLMSGAGAATFGVAPLIVAIGVGVSAIAKIFEAVDNKKEHRYTLKINKWLSDKYKKIFHHDHHHLANKTVPTNSLNHSTIQILTAMPSLEKEVATTKIQDKDQSSALGLSAFSPSKEQESGVLILTEPTPPANNLALSML